MMTRREFFSMAAAGISLRALPVNTACRSSITLPDLPWPCPTKRPSAELRVRASRLLDRVADKVPSADSLRRERALEVLEQIGGPEARAVLEGLAKGAPEAGLTRRAKEALKRLGE